MACHALVKPVQVTESVAYATYVFVESEPEHEVSIAVAICCLGMMGKTYGRRRTQVVVCCVREVGRAFATRDQRTVGRVLLFRQTATPHPPEQRCRLLTRRPSRRPAPMNTTR